MRSIVLALVLPVSGCWFDGELKHDGPTVPEQLDDGWQTATPESVGLSTGVLDEIHRELLREDRHVGTLGFLVIKDRKLVWETYLRTPADRDRPNPLQSATKSVTSLVLGIARDELGGPPLDTPIDTLFVDEMNGMSPDKHAITLRHLLTMTSGIAIDNAQYSMELMVGRPADGLSFILSRSMYAAPGERFYYRDADPQLVSYAIERLVGRDEHAYADERLFAPLGITDYAWEHMRDGAATGPFGLWLKPRDLAKLGQLALDGGEWRGQRIVSQAWIDESTRAQVITDRQDYDRTLLEYGYYWWQLAGAGYAASGHGGQYVLVVPDKQMVVVQIALPYADLHGSVLRDFHELVAPLVE